MNNLRFRKGNLEDLSPIMDLVQRAIEKMKSQGIEQWDALYPIQEDFEADIQNEQLYVVEIDSRIGCIYTLNKEMDEAYELVNWNDESYVVIHRLCVHPDFQHKGLAKMVMKHIMESTNSSIRLDVFSQNQAAMNLYKHLGFTVQGEANWRKGLFYLMEYFKESRA
ncbi:MAG: GNAT family N-acetyltransferase [Bacillota bacterium]|nr:GNAT family N-acetyltransferase [Bacillota bacterium]